MTAPARRERPGRSTPAPEEDDLSTQGRTLLRQLAHYLSAGEDGPERLALMRAWLRAGRREGLQTPAAVLVASMQEALGSWGAGRRPARESEAR